MKKILFALTFLNLLAVQAQESETQGFSKGDFVTSLGISISNEKYENENYKIKGSKFSPSISYFVTDNISVGFNFTNQNKKYEIYGGNDKVNLSSYGLMSRYFLTSKSKFSSSVGLNYNLISGKGGYDIDSNWDNNLKTKGNEITLSYGLHYFISNHFSMFLNLSAFNYRSLKVDGFDKKEVYSTLNLNMDALTLGLAYKL